MIVRPCFEILELTKNLLKSTNSVNLQLVLVQKRKKSTDGTLLSCDLQIYFMLALFHDKNCCICFNFVPYILWDFIVLGLILSY